MVTQIQDIHNIVLNIKISTNLNLSRIHSNKLTKLMVGIAVETVIIDVAHAVEDTTINMMHTDRLILEKTNNILNTTQKYRH